MAGPRVKSVEIPSRWNTRQPAAETQLGKLATRARDEVGRAGKNVEAVMAALSEFHDAWLETGAEAAAPVVEDFFGALVEASGADLDARDAWEEIHLGLFGMECIDEEQFAETVAELDESSVEDAADRVDALLQQVASGLVEAGVARVPELGAFSVEREEGDDDEVLVSVLFQPDSAFRKRAARTLRAGADPDDGVPGPHGVVIEALLDAFMNGWAVDIAGFGTFACHTDEDDEDNPTFVFKAAAELREELAEPAED